MKRKTITLVVYMLVCLSLVSVGFAAWIITGGQGKEVEGNITANPVVDESISIVDGSTKWVSDDLDANKIEEAYLSTISFGKPVTATDEQNNASWLQFDENVPFENLVVVYELKISVKENSVGSAIERLKSNVKLTFDYGAEGPVGAAITKNLITYEGLSYSLDDAGFKNYGAATNTSKYQNNFCEDLAGKTSVKEVKIQVKVEFGWGTEFNNTNPFTHYRAIANPTQTVKDNAYTDLNLLYTTLGGVAPATQASQTFSLGILIGAEPAAQGTN